jgi:CBS domain-containing protein
MKVSSLLKHKGDKVITTSPNTPICDVVNLLNRHHIGAIVVADERGKVNGILSERDVLRGLSEHGATVMTRTASELMSRSVQSCRPSDTISDLVEQMSDHHIRHLPVLEAGRLAGIVSIRDLVQERLAEVEDDMASLRDYLAGDYAIQSAPEHFAAHA